MMVLCQPRDLPEDRRSLAEGTDLRVYRVSRALFLGRTFSTGAFLFARQEVPARGNDVVVVHAQDGLKLSVLSDSRPSACGDRTEVVIFWLHPFEKSPVDRRLRKNRMDQCARFFSGERHILHVDLDAFFVAIERLANPQLLGKPVVVGGSPQGRGVVASASYEARRFGVRSAMPVTQALRLCPRLIVVPAHHDRYAMASREVMRMLRAFSPAVEPVSIDEAYVDLTGTQRLYGAAADACRRLQLEIRDRLHLETSYGLGGNKLVAKVASGLAKPSGLIEVMPGRETDFLAPLPVSLIPGVGRVTNARLGEHGIRSIVDLAQLDRDQLEALFGLYGGDLRARALGLDDAPVVPRDAVKSIGHEETFAADTSDPSFLSSELYRLVEQSARRLRELGCMVRTVQLKLRYADFATKVREATLAKPTDLDNEIFATAWDLSTKLLERDAPVRLIGVRLTNLVGGSTQMGLFDQVDGRSRRRAVIRALDRIRSQFGYDSILTGRVARGRVPEPTILDDQGE